MFEGSSEESEGLETDVYLQSQAEVKIQSSRQEKVHRQEQHKEQVAQTKKLILKLGFLYSLCKPSVHPDLKKTFSGVRSCR